MTDIGAWLWRLLAPLRASPADRALELPGNRVALQIAAICRNDRTLRYYAGPPYGQWYGGR